MATAEDLRASTSQFSAVWEGERVLVGETPKQSVAQVRTGMLVGSVVDAAGLPLPARVTVRNKGRIPVWEGYTASPTYGCAGGLFQIGGLPPGQYTVEASAPGYCAACRSHVLITARDTTFLGHIRLLPAHVP